MAELQRSSGRPAAPSLAWAVICLTALAGGLVASVPADAFAKKKDVAASASVSPPTNRRQRVVVDGEVWVCDGELCAGLAPPTSRGQVRACRDLANAFERVLSFQVAERKLTAEELAACNDA